MVLHNGEGFEDVVCVVAIDAIEKEEGCIELATEGEAAFRVPGEGFAREAKVSRKGIEGVRGVDELEDPGLNPIRYRPCSWLPGAENRVGKWREHGKLFEVEKIKGYAAYFLAGTIVNYKRC